MEQVVCLGDSLTFGYGVDRRETWPALAQAELGGRWINAGICGDTTGGMLIRLLTDILPKHPDCVLLMGGSNDIIVSGDSSRAKENMMAMAHNCLGRGVIPVVGIPIPCRVSGDNPWSGIIAAGVIEEMDRYCAWLRRFASVFGLTSIDFQRDWAAACTPEKANALYQPDGMHPTVEGHRLMARTAANSGITRL